MTTIELFHRVARGEMTPEAAALEMMRRDNLSWWRCFTGWACWLVMVVSWLMLWWQR